MGAACGEPGRFCGGGGGRGTESPRSEGKRPGTLPRPQQAVGSWPGRAPDPSLRQLPCLGPGAWDSPPSWLRAHPSAPSCPPPCSGCLWIQGPGDRPASCRPQSQAQRGRGGSPACFPDQGARLNLSPEAQPHSPCRQAAREAGGSIAGARGWDPSGLPQPAPASQHRSPARGIWGL